MIFPPKMVVYESDATQFINELKKNNPMLEDSQRAGRALLWDKAPIDLDWKRRNDDSRIKQRAYVYGSE
ncbi:MAG: DUF3460 family protein [Burkholderiaceae bacterium]|nr:DUF3460 family protein [Burkholderiaceae bacterium]